MSRSWQANLYALALSSLLMFTAFGFVFPFMPLFIAELGVGGLHEVEVWSGVTAFGQALVLALFSPVWGALSDRYGRRLMVLRVGFVGGAIICLMALSQNIWQFFALRTLQGLFTGVIAASTAMVSSFVPKERIGYALGIMQMSLVVGNSIGPLLGGALADQVGYRPTFLVSGVLMMSGGLVALLAVKEQFVRPPAGEGSNVRAMFNSISVLSRDRHLLLMMLVLFSIHFGTMVVMPILPLFVTSLDPTLPAATFTGIIFTVAGVVAAVSALVLGRSGDRWGHRKLLVIMALGAGLVYIPQAFVQTIGQLIVLRGALGFFDGGLLPAANAIISERRARFGGDHQGATFGLVYMASGMGVALGPLSGGFIAANLGQRSVFVITAAVLLAIGLYLPFGLRRVQRLTATE